MKKKAGCSVEAAVPLLVLHKSWRLIGCHHGAGGNTKTFRVSDVLVIAESRSRGTVGVHLVRRHCKGRVGRAWLPGRRFMTAVSSCSSVVVLGWFVAEHVARGAGGVSVRHGEEVAVATGRQEPIMELNLGVGKGVGWHVGLSDASPGGRLLEFSLDPGFVLDLW